MGYLIFVNKLYSWQRRKNLDEFYPGQHGLFTSNSESGENRNMRYYETTI